MADFSKGFSEDLRERIVNWGEAQRSVFDIGAVAVIIIVAILI